MVQSVEDVRLAQRRARSAPQHRSRGVAARSDAVLTRRDAGCDRGARRLARLLQAGARPDLRRDVPAPRAGRAGRRRSPSPRSCANEGCSTRSAAAPTLLRIQAATPASANAEHYAGIVSELSLLRRLIGVAHDISEMGYNARRRRRRHARPRRGDGVRGRRAPRLRLDDPALPGAREDDGRARAPLRARGHRSAASRRATPTSTRSCSASSRRAS